MKVLCYADNCKHVDKNGNCPRKDLTILMGGQCASYQDDEYICECGEPIEHKDSNICSSCAIDRSESLNDYLPRG